MYGVESADGFDALADETRIRILQELGRGRGGESDSRTYSELMDAVGVRDSGRFNYHLTKLCDHYVTRTETGYKLSYEGVLVYRSIIAGTGIGHPPSESFDVGSDCHRCGCGLLARSADHILFITCPDCETTFVAGYLPPRGYSDRTADEILDALDERIRYQMGLITRSVCPWCSGTTSPSILPVTETPLEDRPIEVTVFHECHQCEAHAWMTVGQRLLDHPAVVSFHYRHDIDITRPLWEFPFAVTDRCTTLHDTEPLRVALSLRRGHTELRIELDETADVRDVTWSSRDDHSSET